MTDNNSKLRAVLLAALMVLWVFAGTMAFAGSAAAVNEGADVTISNIAVDDGSTDATATYTITSEVSDGPATVGSMKLDFNDASTNGIDVSSASIDSVTSDNEDAAIDTSTTGGNFVNATFTGTAELGGTVTVTVSGINNPSDAGDYQLEQAAWSGTSFDGSSSNSTDTYAIGTTQERNEASGADKAWTSATTRWQGQDLFFDRSTAPDDLSNYQLREFDNTAVSEENRVGNLETELTFDGDTTLIDTSDLEGDYVITATREGEGRRVIITGSNGGYNSDVGPATGDSEDAPVEIAVQDLDATLEDEDGDEVDEVSLDDTANLTLDSNRNGYDLNVSSENLTQNQLETLFTEDGDLSDADIDDTRDEDNITLLGLQSDEEIELNFSSDNDIESGDVLDFNFEVDDTTANASTSIDIQDEVDGSVDFEQAQYTEQRGDIVTLNMTENELDEFDLTIGGDNVNYKATVTVEPNDDGVVKIDINTYLLSRVPADYGQQRDVFYAEEGEITNAEDNIGEVSRDRVLDPDLYDVIAQESVDDDPQEYDVAVINLEERSTGNHTVHTAPHSEFNNINDLEDVQEMLNEDSITESREIAIKDSDERTDQDVRGDTVVHKVDASGIEGAIAAEGGDNFSALEGVRAPGDIDDDGDDEDVPAFGFGYEQTNPQANQDRIEADLRGSADDSEFPEEITDVELIPDPNNDSYYIIVRSDFLADDDGPEPAAEPGARFNTSFNVSGAYQNLFLRQDDHVDPVDEDDQESAGNQFQLVDREAEFDTVNDTVRVAPAENETITGETTVAPGTEITVRARATGESPFLLTNTTTVNPDGTFAGTFDFSDVSVGQEFNTTIRSQSFEDDVETDGLVTETDLAEVEISNQTTDGTTATVDRVYVPDGGFVTIHDGTLLDGATFDSVRGTSDYLESGEHEDVEVTLDTPYEGDNGTVIAMPHMDTNDNETYDFVTSEGEEDGAYTDAEGEIILDSAALTVDTSTPTPTATATATPEPTATATDEATATETASEDQPGFGAVIALIALLGAALLAARRNAF